MVSFISGEFRHAQRLTETLPPDAPKRRRRATRRDMEVRDLRIFQKFAAGCSVEEIALRERVTQRRVRERLQADLRAAGDRAAGGEARLADPPPERGLFVSWSAMAAGNLSAVDRVVKITRQLDRYYGVSLQQLEKNEVIEAVAKPAALAPPVDLTLKPGPSL